MKLRKIIATITVATLFFWAPSFIPMRVTQAPVKVAGVIGCGTVVSRTADTAYAVGVLIPCPVAAAPTPWAVIGIGAATLSVILNSIIVSQTQCRELTMNEARSSFFLPFVGIALNQKLNHCHH